MNKDLICYAQQYVSFLLSRLDEEEISNIKEIILFGSVARGEDDSESDIDLFVNEIKHSTALQEKIKKLVDKFYQTEFYKLWKVLGIENEINPTVGILDTWKLKNSIITNGITLYGKYLSKPDLQEQFALIYWDPIKSPSKRVLLSKKLYGYDYKKSYEGVLQKLKGKKIATNCILVGIPEVKIIIDLFKKLKVSYRIIYAGKI